MDLPTGDTSYSNSGAFAVTLLPGSHRLSLKKTRKTNLEKDIIFDITFDKGWFEIDLSPYNIYLEGMEKIGVTIQWIKSSGRKNDNNYFGIPAGMISFNGALSRQKSEAACLS